MSVDNFVQCRVVTPLSASSVQVVLLDAEPPYQLPPADGGTLVLCDSVGRPSFLEVISYTSRNGLVLYGVSRGQEGTTALTWNGVTYLYQALTADQYEASLFAKVDKVTGKQLSTEDYSSAEKTKLAGVATNATKNATDAQLRDRTTHTGVQAISTVTGLQAALDAKVNNAQVGSANGVASLGADGKVPPAQLPSYVDDVLEVASFAVLPVTGEAGKIYVALDTDSQYRWSGTAYVQLTASPGTTDSVPEGTTNIYFTVARVRATALTGLSTATNAVISATDTVLTGLGKLQKQISDAATNLASNVRGTVITGYVVGTNTALAATDTLLAALGKVQGQLNAKANAADAALTGVPTAPTAAPGTNTLQVANTAFVQQGVAGKEPVIAGGTNAQFWRGDKSWQDFAAAARGVALTGLSTASATAIAATDTVLGALGKLQAQITTEAASLAADVRAVVLTGYLAGANTALAATDTVLAAFGKVQGQLNAKLNLSGGTLTGQLLADDGTQAAPGLSFNGDSNTGLFWMAADKIGVACGGVLAAYFTATEQLNAGNLIVSTQDDLAAGATTTVRNSARLYLRGKYWNGTASANADWSLINNVTSAAAAGNQLLFQVTGVTKLTLTNAGDLTAVGNVTAYSDARLKRDITPITQALDKVQALHGVTYTRIDSGDRHTGLLAQDVQDVLPEAVLVAADEQHTLSVAYGNLVGLLVEAIKELRAEVTSLKQDVVSLERL